MKTVIKPDIRYFHESIQKVIESHSQAQMRVEIHKAISAEREACAKVCEEQSKELGGVAEGPFVTDFGKHTHMSMAAGAENCATAIRARSNT